MAKEERRYLGGSRMEGAEPEERMEDWFKEGGTTSEFEEGEVVRGSGRAWPRGRWLPRPAKVVVTFGPPLRFERPAGAGKKEYYDAVSRDMMAAIARLSNH